MLVYGYYCKAFPVRNQVCDFLEVLVTQDPALFQEEAVMVPYSEQ